MYCKRCGRELDDSFKVCPYCGEPVNDEPLLNNQDYQIYENMNNNSYPVNNEGSAVGWGILSFMVPLVGIILSFAWNKTKPRTARTCLTCGLVSMGLNFISLLFLML